MSNSVEIHGFYEPRFERVRDVLADSFASGDELGASVCVLWEGQTVVDLWAGHADEAKTRPWAKDSLVNVFSTTKGMTALCALRLVEQGLLDLERPVADYWPEFAAAGKQDLPVRFLFNHQAGLPAIAATMEEGALYVWERMVAALAAQEPWWEPGAQHGYHAISFGFLVGELVRRVSGRSVGIDSYWIPLSRVGELHGPAGVT